MNKRIKRKIIESVLGVSLLTVGVAKIIPSSNQNVVLATYSHSSKEGEYDTILSNRNLNPDNINEKNLVGQSSDKTYNQTTISTDDKTTKNVWDFEDIKIGNSKVDDQPEKYKRTLTINIKPLTNMQNITSVSFDSGEKWDVFRTLNWYDADNGAFDASYTKESLTFWNGFGSIDESGRNDDLSKSDVENWDEMSDEEKAKQEGITNSVTITPDSGKVLISSIRTPMEHNGTADYYDDTEPSYYGSKSGWKGWLSMKLYGELDTEGNFTFTFECYHELDSDEFDGYYDYGNHNTIKGIHLPEMNVKGELIKTPLYEYDDSWNTEIINNSISNTKKIWTSEDKIYYDGTESTINSLEYIVNKSLENSNMDWVGFNDDLEFIFYDSDGNKIEEGGNLSDSNISFEVVGLGEDATSNFPSVYDGNENKTARFDLEIPYVESYNILTNLDGDGLSESGNASSFFVEKTDKSSEWNIYANDDIKLEFVTDGWLTASGPDGYQTGQVLTFETSTDFGLLGEDFSSDIDIYNNWTNRIWFLIPDSEVDGENTVTSNDAINILESNGLEYEVDDQGVWTSAQNLDEIYPVGDGGSGQYSKSLHSKMRWSYIFSPEYNNSSENENSGSESTLGRNGKETHVLTAFSNASGSEISTPLELEKYKFNLIFDSTPLLDREVNTNENLFYTAEQTWGDADPGSLVNDYEWEDAAEIQWTKGYEEKIDIFGNSVEEVKSNGEYVWSGTGNNPWNTTITDSDGNPITVAEYTYTKDSDGKVVWDEDADGNSIADTTYPWYDESKVNGNPDGANEDTPAQMEAEGNKTSTDYKHYITQINTEEEEFRDVFVINLGNDGTGEVGSGYTLDEWIGSLSETDGIHWFYDGDFIFESNPFIKTISTGEVVEVVEDDYPYAVQEVILNKGDPLEMKAWLVYTETTPEFCIEYQLTERGYEDYFQTTEGRDLLDNIESRQVLNFTKLNEDTGDEEEMSNEERATLANKEFDAHSLAVQKQIYLNSINIDSYSDLDDEIALWGLQQQLDYSSDNLINTIMFKPGNSLSKEEIEWIQEGIDSYLPYVTFDGYSTILGSEWKNETQVLNPKEWTIRVGDFYYMDGNVGENTNNITDLTFDEYNQLNSSNYITGNISSWDVGDPTNRAGTKIPENYSTISVNESGEIIWGGELAVEVKVIHNPTRNSNVYGERSLYIPIWVTDLSVYLLQQLDDEVVDSFVDILEFMAMSTEFEPPSNYEVFVNPKNRTTLDPGKNLNTYGNSYDQWARGGSLTQEEQWYFDYCEERDIEPLTPEETGDWKSSNGQWEGFGDNPINNVLDTGEENPYSKSHIDESDDDVNKGFVLTKQQYINFLYNQNIWGLVPDENSDDGYKEEIVDTSTFFTDLLFNFTDLTSNDISFEFGINGKQLNEISSTEAILADDEITVWVHGVPTNENSKWIVKEPEGGIEYSFNVWVPDNLELPDVQPPTGKEEDTLAKIPWFGWVLMVIAIIAMIIPIIWWIMHKRKAKNII